jgi:hypothetical protein
VRAQASNECGVGDREGGQRGERVSSRESGRRGGEELLTDIVAGRGAALDQTRLAARLEAELRAIVEHHQDLHCKHWLCAAAHALGVVCLRQRLAGRLTVCFCHCCIAHGQCE